MTKKRFTKCDTKIRDYGEEMSQAEVRDLLNALHEENEQLKQDVEYWKQVASQRGNEIEVMTHKLQMK